MNEINIETSLSLHNRVEKELWICEKDLFYIAKCFEDIGNETLAQKLNDIALRISDARVNANRAFDMLQNHWHEQSEQASLNILATALALSGIINDKET